MFFNSDICLSFVMNRELEYSNYSHEYGNILHIMTLINVHTLIISYLQYGCDTDHDEVSDDIPDTSEKKIRKFTEVTYLMVD